MNTASQGLPQSALRAAGPIAQTLLEVSGVLAVGGALIFAGVMLLLVLAVRRRGGSRVSTRWWVLGGECMQHRRSNDLRLFPLRHV